MYQARVRRAVSPQVVETASAVEAEMWALFLAIGTHWQLTDDTDGYRGRLQAFMANRVSLDVELSKPQKIFPGIFPLKSRAFF